MKKPELILSPTDFVAIANQALERVFGNVCIEGELSNFKISKNRWVYFDIKDDISKVACFGSVYDLPGPLKDGMLVKILGQPRLHPQFGFKISFASITASGEGSIKKAFELLKAKLNSEGLFLESRKRSISYPPIKIGLITSNESAAYADFIKIINIRWPLIVIELYNVQVQGVTAIKQITDAIIQANNMSKLAEVLVITRGGGSSDDLAVFNDERVVRAISASRIPTIVAIGHETDESLAEMVADKRASTPSNAAELLVPDKNSELKYLMRQKSNLNSFLLALINNEFLNLKNASIKAHDGISKVQHLAEVSIKNYKLLLKAFNPQNVLKRGYAILSASGKIIKSANSIRPSQKVEITIYDAKLDATINKIKLTRKGV